MNNKLGLALSGGGLRASFFHIGVLAQMAEQGLLRSVEVISSVSGGSIIAALYYLHLKKLLESRNDREINDQDYVDLVRTIETEFIQATQKNFRMLTFADFEANWKMHREDYSRSDRIGELYDELLYRPVLEKTEKVGMHELIIRPKGEPLGFNPRKDNQGRTAKVPILILNATTLNTGRNWHFTARTMGEPCHHDELDRPIFDETDSIPIRLRRPRPGYVINITPRHKDFPLGAAVAASAGVPGLFPPMSVTGLYQEEDGDPVSVQLVDGGVHDNQGINALLYERCTHFVICDASGQMAFDPSPDTGTVGVLNRSSEILQNQVRSQTLKTLFATVGYRDKIAFMHLHQGLGKKELAWIGTDGQPVFPPRVWASKSLEQCGVHPEVQKRLAKIRTDLDAFSEVEACSLMLDGYLLSAKELERSHGLRPFLSAATPVACKWNFQRLLSEFSNPNDKYLHQLEVASLNIGKAVLLNPWLLVLTVATAGILLFMLWPTLSEWLSGSIPIMTIVAVIALFLLDWLGKRVARLKEIRKLGLDRLLRTLGKALSWYQSGKRIVVKVALPLIGTFLVQAYLKLINPLFLKSGRLGG